MNFCPNTSLPEAKTLIEKLGLLGFYKEYIRNGYNIPTMETTVNSNEILYQNQTQSTEGIIAAEKTIRDLAARMSVGFEGDELPFQKIPQSELQEVDNTVKEGVRDVFNNTPELSKIGTQEQYSEYLNTIFPDSKVKDIVYHGTDVNREQLSSIANRLKTRLNISQEGSDGFGYVLGLFDNKSERIGKIVYRNKTYLKNKGFPNVNELHLGFGEEYQGKGYFQDALIELLQYDGSPIFISDGRVINDNVFKAINKLDTSKLNINKIEDGYIITLNKEYVYDKTGGEEGIYFTNLKERAEYYSDWRSGFNISAEVNGTNKVPNYIVYAALLDIKSPSKGDEIKNKATISTSDRSKLKGDGLVYDTSIQNGKQEVEYVVFQPEQIHILGSKQDIEGFKEFVNSNLDNSDNNSTFVDSENKEIYNDVSDFMMFNDIYNLEDIQIDNIEYKDDSNQPLC